MSVDTALVEIVDSHGRVQSRERVALDAGRTFTVGRSVSADVTLDDPYAAPIHARIEITETGSVRVTDLNTVNGLVIGGNRVTGEQSLTRAELQIGRTRLRIRHTRETLAPEKPDRMEPAALLRQPALIAGVAAFVGLLQLIYSAWSGAPRDLTNTVVTTLISALLGAGAWVAFWALLSRVMQGDWRWLRHAAIFLGVAAVSIALEGLLELMWFSFALPEWNLRMVLLGALAFGVALYFHLMHASNLGSRRAALIACLIPAISAGVSHWLLERSQARDVNHISTTQRIYPPALRVTTSGTVDDYFRAANELRAAADKKRKALPDSDEGADSDDD